jgi:hypothetical protein
LVENCISEGTEVLTDRGWVCIEGIKVSDKVHDGVEFVSHHGIVDKSVQGCIEIDGVYMTPDHEVLTDEGWVRAERCERPYRPEIRDITFDALLPDKKRLAYRDNRNQTIIPKRVFDVINCGPRQRFVVRGVQGLARCVVGEQMLLISKRYRPALTVHDAAVVVVPEEEKDEAVAFTEDCMSFVPKWAEGLPVACESGVDFSYGGT